MSEEPLDPRLQKGLETMAALDGKGPDAVDPKTAEQTIAFLGPIGQYVIEFAMGDLYSRPGLSLRDRELVAISSLTVLGHETQLRTRIGTALKVGLTAQEIEEAMIQTVVFNGFPTAINAVMVLKSIVAEAA
jgi:4-carboxymuconolactone decarboxylase